MINLHVFEKQPKWTQSNADTTFKQPSADKTSRLVWQLQAFLHLKNFYKKEYAFVSRSLAPMASNWFLICLSDKQTW